VSGVTDPLSPHRIGERVLRPIGAGVAAALLAVAFTELAAAPALEARGRSWEMGGIPFLFAAIFFAPLLAALVAGLFAPRRVYWAAGAAAAALAIAAGAVTQFQNNPGLSFIALTPFGLPLIAWGAVLVDATPAGWTLRLRGLRDATYAPAGILSFMALLPPSLDAAPGVPGLVLAAVIPAAFFLWLARRNTRARV
jgi:hypothetical protein